MRLRIAKLGLAVVFMIMVGSNLTPSSEARAAGFYHVFAYYGVGATCNETEMRIPVRQFSSFPVGATLLGEFWLNGAFAGGVRYTRPPSDPAPASGVDLTLTWPGAPLPYTYRIDYSLTVNGALASYTHIEATCTVSGAMVTSFSSTYDVVEGDVASIEPIPAGPPVPMDSRGNQYPVLTVTCDTPVYDAPGGKAVENASLSAGQTWYISPEDVAAPDGSMWRAVFVSSYTPVYIPSSCVQW